MTAAHTTTRPEADPEHAAPEAMPVRPAAPGDHEALLNEFLDTQGEWEKYRTWSDSTTHAVHEDLTLRAEFVHEADPRDTAWTIAAYESPVGERIWHATATASTPTDVVRTLLDSLASGDAWGAGLDTKVSEKTLAEATRPFADTGWPQTSDGRCMNWTAPDAGAAGLRFDAFAAQHANGPLPTWTLWGGNTPTSPPGPSTSPHTPPPQSCKPSPTNSHTAKAPANSQTRARTRPCLTPPEHPCRANRSRP